MGEKKSNDQGVFIESHTDKNEKEHLSFYDRDPKDPEHASIHINWDYKTGKGEIVDTTSGEKVTTDTQCYLTTACLRHFKKSFNDNCQELSILRWFRDNYVSKEDIVHYYSTAPIIVEKLEKMDNNEKVYEYLYTNVILSCVDAIKRCDYEFAYNRYMISIKALERIFVIKEKELIKRI